MSQSQVYGSEIFRMIYHAKAVTPPGRQDLRDGLESPNSHGVCFYSCLPKTLIISDLLLRPTAKICVATPPLTATSYVMR